MALAPSRKLAVLVLSLVLLSAWPAQALPLDRPAEPLSKIVVYLTEFLTVLLGDVGCSADPNGGCLDRG